MDIKVVRIARKANYTIGKMYINGVYFCDTLEDTDRGITSSTSEAEIAKIKVYGKTAIPTGTYKVSWTMSSRFKKMMPLVEGVKGFSGIRIHSGNKPEDTLGCILCGYNKVVGQVVDSRVTCERLYARIKGAIKANERITLTVA